MYTRGIHGIEYRISDNLYHKKDLRFLPGWSSISQMRLEVR